ncbi:MAG: hypothetical protein ACE5KF_11595 [Kiloniellaceae bacterium]
MMKHLAPFTVLLIALPTAAGHAVAQEWKAVAAEDARIVFTAPGMSDLLNKFGRRTSDNRLGQEEWGIWLGGKQKPLAFTLTVITFPGAVIRREIDHKKFVSGLEILKEAPIRWGQDGKSRNSLGKIKYTAFAWSARACVGFKQYFGEAMDDRQNLGANLVTGFYCASPRESLSDEGIETVLGSIRFRK